MTEHETIRKEGDPIPWVVIIPSQPGPAAYQNAIINVMNHRIMYPRHNDLPTTIVTLGTQRPHVMRARLLAVLNDNFDVPYWSSKLYYRWNGDLVARLSGIPILTAVEYREQVGDERFALETEIDMHKLP